MTLDREILAEKAALVERHLARVAQRLPPSPGELQAMTDACDAVVLHLWQATQLVIDVAMAACLRLHLGTPASYADAFERLRAAGALDAELAGRLARAAGFRNVVVHAYGTLDLHRLHGTAKDGPRDLRAFLAVVATRV